MEAKDISALQSLSPFEFENLVRDVFVALGYDVELTRQSGDEGVDLRLSKSGEQSIAQCKRYRGQVGPAAVRDFYGTVMHSQAKRGYLVTTGTFSLASEAWALGKNVVLVDGTDLLGSIDTLEIAVQSPQVSTTASPLFELFEALARAASENSTARRECLYVVFLGAPPRPHTYQELSDALINVLGISPGRARYIEEAGLLAELMSRSETNVNGDFWFYEDDDCGPELLEWLNIAKFGGELHFEEKYTAPDVHIAMGFWNAREFLKPKREPDSRSKRDLEAELDRAGYVEIEARLLDWNNLLAQLSDGLAVARLAPGRQSND